MNYKQLKKNANKMVVKGKGILAADESSPTCTKRFDSIETDSTRSLLRPGRCPLPSRFDYRENGGLP